jgi:hypothetical protein
MDPSPRRFLVPMVAIGLAEARFTLKDESSAQLAGGGGAAIAKNPMRLTCRVCT